MIAVALSFTRYLLAKVGLALDGVSYGALRDFAVRALTVDTGYSFYRSPYEFDREFRSALLLFRGCVSVDGDVVRFSKDGECVERYRKVVEFEERYEVPHVRSAVLAVRPEVEWFIELARLGDKP